MDLFQVSLREWGFFIFSSISIVYKLKQIYFDSKSNFNQAKVNKNELPVSL